MIPSLTPQTRTGGHRGSRRARGLTARGYTAVEVLMAMTVMAIGATGVMSMQRASVQGNLDAREADIANSIARTWVERVQRDGMQWTSPGPTNGTASNLGTTALVLQAGTASAGQWFLPSQYIGLTPPLSPGFDILGRDLGLADLPTALFCVNVRLTWLSKDDELIRADVRVLWPRSIASVPVGGACAPATQNRPDPVAYHALYVTTAVRGNPQ
jgi:prepilin-type N-terminal cleavage/methylation domain-containing protein